MGSDSLQTPAPYADTVEPSFLAVWLVTSECLNGLKFGGSKHWVDTEEEILYVGYYQGGLRALDISGELLGDLYAQGREIAHFFSDDPEAYIAFGELAFAGGRVTDAQALYDALRVVAGDRAFVLVALDYWDSARKRRKKE